MKLEIFFSFLISNSILKSCISGMIDIQKAQISFGLSIYAGMNGLLKIFHRFMISHLYYIKLYILHFHAGIEEHDLKLRHLLRFVTGCYSLPPLGLLDSIKIKFLHGCHNAWLQVSSNSVNMPIVHQASCSCSYISGNERVDCICLAGRFWVWVCMATCKLPY
jgi:hypothetical protein